MRLAGILDDRETTRPRHLEDRPHVDRLTVEMDRKDRPGAVGDRLLDEIRVESERLGIDVHEYRPAAGLGDRLGRRDEAQRGGDDLVAGAAAAQLRGQQREAQRVGAARHRNRVRHAAEGGELALEPFDLGAADVATGGEHALDRRPEVLSEVGERRAQVDGGDTAGRFAIILCLAGNAHPRLRAAKGRLWGSRRCKSTAPASRNPRGADGLQNRDSGDAGRRARRQIDARPARHDPLTEVAHQRLAPRPDAQLPPERVRRPAETAQVARVQPFLVMADAERHQVVVFILPLLRPENNVVLVQTAARGAAGDHATPAVALEDAIAPLPLRVVRAVPRVAQPLDE